MDKPNLLTVTQIVYNVNHYVKLVMILILVQFAKVIHSFQIILVYVLAEMDIKKIVWENVKWKLFMKIKSV